MAQIRYRANLSAKDFVFASQNWGRSIILKQYDQNFSRQIVSPTDPDKDIGIPQIFYAHNVMPAAQGFQSVGFNNVFPGPAGIGVGDAFQVLPWESTTNNNRGYVLFTFTSSNLTQATFDVWSITVGYSTNWVHQGQVTMPLASKGVKFTCALVGGTSYYYVPSTGCYSFDGATWSPVTLTGLTASQIGGITASFGYMIAWSQSAIAWSSTVSPTDFTPSLITGAGGGSVQALKGAITNVAHHTFGFIVFSQLNCVAAVYSGNTRYPFNYREIIGGGGLSAPYQLIDLDSESGNLYGYTTAGLQIISVTQAQPVFPEVTNFLGGSRFEDFNDTTLQFLETDVGIGKLNKQLQVIANRYLVLSYGIVTSFPQQFTHALIYDIAMKRWGKLRITHIQAFEYLDQANAIQNNARNSLAFLDPNGQIFQADFSQLATTGGTILLGKYQHARDRLITLQQVDLEYIQNTNNVTLNVFPTFDGKTFQSPTQLTAIDSTTNAPQYPCRITGMNLSLCLQGQFMLDSLMLTYSSSGRR